MLRAAVFALALVGLTMLTAGVLDAAPVVFWGTHDELAAIDHGRRTMLAGAGLTIAAASLAAALDRRAAALLAAAAVLPAVAVLAAPHTSLGLLVLVAAVPAGLGGAIVGGTRPHDAPRLAVSALLGIVTVAAAAASGVAWGVVVATALALVAYVHARARDAGPRAALTSLVPGTAFAALAGAAVWAGGSLAA